MIHRITLLLQKCHSNICQEDGEKEMLRNFDKMLTHSSNP